MRLWSVHPKYLDSKGLVALWREALLAQKVLSGHTKGYRHHPQLVRFQNLHDPLAGIAQYLKDVWQESKNRGYSFNYSKIVNKEYFGKIPITEGQLNHEFQWLRQKLAARDFERYKKLNLADVIEAHPLFVVVNGEIAEWEKSILE